MSAGRRLGWLVLGLLGAVVLGGCDGRGRYVGTWELDKAAMREVMAEGAADAKEDFGALGEALARQMSNRLIEGTEVTLEVERDGTWTMTRAAMGETSVQKGAWKLEEGEMVMTREGGPEVRARVEDGRLWVDRGEKDMKLALMRAGT